MKLKQAFLLIAALLMVSNLGVAADKDLAKGCLYAWSAVMLADGKTPNAELALFNNFAKVSTTTKSFYNDKWIAKGFEEAIITWKKQGMEALIKKLPAMLKGADEVERKLIIINFLMLAKADKDFNTKEIGVIQKIVKAVNFSRDDVLFAAMMYASRN